MSKTQTIESNISLSEVKTKTIEKVSSSNKNKLSRSSLTIFPLEIIKSYSKLPKNFKKRDVDILIGDKICRDMKWRYLKKMEKLGLIRHTSKKCYEKSYENFSDWVQTVVLPKIRTIELTG
jgi:hypothetical protein